MSNKHTTEEQRLAEAISKPHILVPAKPGALEEVKPSALAHPAEIGGNASAGQQKRETHPASARTKTRRVKRPAVQKMSDTQELSDGGKIPGDQTMGETQLGGVTEAPGPTGAATQTNRAGGDISSDQSTFETLRSGVTGADDHSRGGTRLSLVVGPLIEHHRRRVDFHRAEKRLTLQIKGICRRLLMGTGMDRAKATKESAALYKAATGKADHPLAMVCQLHTAPLFAARAPLEQGRKDTEKAMEKMVKQLPIWEYWDGIKGVSALSLAALIGEAGDLSKYSNPAKLWKRMGVGLVQNHDGKWTTQGRPGKGAPAEDWVRHGYNKQRRSVLWNIGAGLLRAQKKDNLDYYALYAERRLHEEAKGLKKIEVHRRSQRYMEKRLLREVWKEWRRLSISEV